ncbi:MAG: hypothetical protein WAO35_12625, partial [Terriglobia bacterium]
KRRWTTIALSQIWMVLTRAGVVAMWLPRNRQGFSAAVLPETLFASIYALFLFTFNATDYIAWGLSRYVIPVLPMFLFSLRNWIPHNRRVLWVGALLSAMLASAGIVGFRDVFGFSLP